MALYAIGDPHLSFQANKPMDVFGEVWKDHPIKLKQGFERQVSGRRSSFSTILRSIGDIAVSPS